MTLCRNFLVALIMLVGLADIGRAEESHFGPVTFTRGAEIKGMYDSNIFLSPGQPLGATEVASGIGSFTADLGFEFDLKRTQAFLGYQINLLQYDKYPSANNAVNQCATLWITYESGKSSSLGLADQFMATTDPASSELVERARRNQNDVIGNLEFGLGQSMFLGAGVHHGLHYYLVSGLAEQLNRKSLAVSPQLGYKITAKTRVFAEFTHQTVKYDETLGQLKDNTSKSIQAVAAGEFTSRLKGSVSAGVTMKDYDTSVTKTTDSRTLPSWKVGLSYAAPMEFTFSVMTSQAAQESLYNRFYITMLNMVSVGKPFGKKVNASAFGMVINDTYPDAGFGSTVTNKRLDQTVQAGVTLTVTPTDWLEIAASYLNRARASNVDVFDYKDSVISLGVTAVY